MLWPLSLQKARYWLAKQRPYLASALWAIVPVEKPGLGTMAIDRWWRLYFDPCALEQWTVEEIAGVLYHEILHLLRKHSERMKAFPPDIGNLAADAEINDDLRLENVKLPGQPVYPELLGQEPFKLAEEYASNLLIKQNGEGNRENNGDGSDKKAGSSSGQSREGSGQSEPGPSSGKSGEGSSKSEPGPSQSGDGSAEAGPSSSTGDGSASSDLSSRVWSSGSTGHKAEWELGEPDENNPGISEAEGELIRRQVARDIQQHKTRGTVPAHLERWAEELLNPRVDWRRVLASAIRTMVGRVSGMKDYSYHKPSRRQSIYGKVVMPTLYSPRVRVAIVVDTSGSIDNELLARALAETNAIIKQQNVEAWVLSVDAEVHTVQKVFRTKDIKLIGGGGTDMGVGLEKAIELKPDAIIVLTDGYTPWPSEPPKVPVIVGLLDKDGDAPKWARKIIIEGVI